MLVLRATGAQQAVDALAQAKVRHLGHQVVADDDIGAPMGDACNGRAVAMTVSSSGAHETADSAQGAGSGGATICSEWRCCRGR